MGVGNLEIFSTARQSGFGSLSDNRICWFFLFYGYEGSGICMAVRGERPMGMRGRGSIDVREGGQ